jgi:hypothetical protein
MTGEVSFNKARTPRGAASSAFSIPPTNHHIAVTPAWLIAWGTYRMTPSNNSTEGEQS